MNETFSLIAATALASSLLTLLLGYLFYMAFIRKKMERRMMEMADIVQDRVRRGATQAGEDLLPQFREKVTEGFKQALREWTTGDFRSKAKVGMNLVEESLSTLFGPPRGRSSGKD